MDFLDTLIARRNTLKSHIDELTASYQVEDDPEWKVTYSYSHFRPEDENCRSAK